MRSQRLVFAFLSMAVAGLLLGASARMAFKDEIVLEQSFEAPRQITTEIPVRAPNERHTVEVITSGSVALTWLVDDPDGEMISGGREFAKRAGNHRFHFTPRDSGNYRLQVDSVGPASITDAKLRVTVEHPGPVARLLSS